MERYFYRQNKTKQNKSHLPDFFINFHLLLPFILKFYIQGIINIYFFSLEYERTVTLHIQDLLPDRSLGNAIILINIKNNSDRYTEA